MSFGGVNQTGATGAPIFGNQGSAAAGAVPGQAGAPANGATPYFGASFESIMAAVSRGELSLNMQVQAGNQFGGVGNAAGNPTLLQAISQGLPQNGTNGLNGVGAGGGTVNSSMASCNNQPGSFAAGAAVGGTQTVDAKQMVSSASVVPGTSVANPAPVQAASSNAASGGSVANGTWVTKVSAITAYGETAASNEQSTTTGGTGISTITVTWSAVLGATAYKVYFGNAGAGSENVVQNVGNVLTNTFTSIPATSGTPLGSTAIQYGGN